MLKEVIRNQVIAAGLVDAAKHNHHPRVSFGQVVPVAEKMVALSLKNSVLCGNNLYLSQKRCEARSEERKTEVRNANRDDSVVTWQYVSLPGAHHFSDEKRQTLSV